MTTKREKKNWIKIMKEMDYVVRIRILGDKDFTKKNVCSLQAAPIHSIADFAVFGNSLTFCVH